MHCFTVIRAMLFGYLEAILHSQVFYYGQFIRTLLLSFRRFEWLQRYANLMTILNAGMFFLRIMHCLGTMIVRLMLTNKSKCILVTHQLQFKIHQLDLTSTGHLAVTSLILSDLGRYVDSAYIFKCTMIIWTWHRIALSILYIYLLPLRKNNLTF